jgi:hypothetical protein
VTYSEEEEKHVCRAIRTVLGAVAVMFSSLAAASLDTLLQLNRGDTVRGLLQDLHSMLDAPDEFHQPIRLQHASICDFLLDELRCTDRHFWVDGQLAHTLLAHRCLQVMADNLRKDICDLQSPGVLASDVSQELVDARSPPHLRYE